MHRLIFERVGFYPIHNSHPAQPAGCSQNTERTAFDDEAELKREVKAKRAAEEQERMRGTAP